LGLNEKYLYTEATKKGIKLRDYLSELDGLTEVDKRMAVGTKLMDDLSNKSTLPLKQDSYALQPDIGQETAKVPSPTEKPLETQPASLDAPRVDAGARQEQGITRSVPTPRVKGVKTIIRENTGQVKKTTLIEDDSGQIVEFDTKDLNKYYKEIEQQQKQSEYISKTEKQEKAIADPKRFKQTPEYQDFADYAEKNLNKTDIQPALFGRHLSMTAERVMEYLEGGIGGKGYQTIIKPVYDSAAKMAVELDKIGREIKTYKIVEGSKESRAASLYAQKTPNVKAEGKVVELADYARSKYDEWLERANVEREKSGLEPIKKRKDYITHMNELSTLAEYFGGIDRITINQRISEIKTDLLAKHSDWSEARAFEAAKKTVEGTTGITQYIDAKQPYFRWMNERLIEWEKNPDIMASLNAYIEPVMRSIYQTVNISRNKAFKDLLPANAKEFFRIWNSELVGGRSPSPLHPVIRKPINMLRATIGGNTIMGNAGVMVMQLTSWPQVVALAGVRNTLFGIGRRIGSYLSNDFSRYTGSRTQIMRNLDLDIGMGNSLMEEGIKWIGQNEKAKTASVKTRVAINFGKTLFKNIMQQFDQFTVGATYESFLNKALKEGMNTIEARDYADIMTGKTQANYFKEGLSPFLNSQTGKTFGQFGTYGFNQWEMFKKDFGKKYNYGGNTVKSKGILFKQFVKYLTVAYFIDMFGENLFGRQPFNVKSFVDENLKAMTGKFDIGKYAETAKDILFNIVPFTSSIKFNSMPPVLQFGNDVLDAILSSGTDAAKAYKNLVSKWSFNILLPYGGTQLKKTLEGAEAAYNIDIPLVSDPSKTTTGKTRYSIEDNLEKIKALIFGAGATKPAMDYYDPESKPVPEWKQAALQEEQKKQDRTGIYKEVDSFIASLEGKTTTEQTKMKMQLLKDNKPLFDEVKKELSAQKEKQGKEERKALGVYDESVAAKVQYIKENISKYSTKSEKMKWLLEMKNKGVYTASVKEKLPLLDIIK
jgi:hypothetical protein